MSKIWFNLAKENILLFNYLKVRPTICTKKLTIHQKYKGLEAAFYNPTART